MRRQLYRVIGLLPLMIVAGACSDDGASSTSGESAWVEEEVTFSFDEDELYGVLTLPTDECPHPAVLLVSGSGGPTGERAGTSTRVFVDHSRQFAIEGFATLRYDPPGVGRSTGDPGLPSLEKRVEETAAALARLRSLRSIDAETVGLLGYSQGPWVTAMTSVRHPDDVAYSLRAAGCPPGRE
jgi:pimeloyl-ACP methyl ester carboxylesterase